MLFVKYIFKSIDEASTRVSCFLGYHSPETHYDYSSAPCSGIYKESHLKVFCPDYFLKKHSKKCSNSCDLAIRVYDKCVHCGNKEYL